MAVAIFGPTYDALCGKTIRAPAVASADFVDSLKRPILSGSTRSALGLMTGGTRPKGDIRSL